MNSSLLRWSLKKGISIAFAVTHSAFKFMLAALSQTLFPKPSEVKDIHRTQAASQWISARCLSAELPLELLADSMLELEKTKEQSCSMKVCITGAVCQWVIPNYLWYKNEQTVRLSVFTLWGTEPKTWQRHGDVHASQQERPAGTWRDASVSLSL